MDRFFEDRWISPGSWLTWSTNGTNYLPVDIYETADDIVVRALTPGVSPNDIDVQYQNGTLTIRTQTPAHEPESGATWLVREIAAGQAVRQVTLPRTVDVEGVAISPKRLLDALLYPHVQMQEDDRDITLLRVVVIGEAGGKRQTRTIEMVDYYDEVLGFTSMARVTAFTASILARMVGRGELKGVGIFTPEKLVTGRQFERLRQELAAVNIVFQESVAEQP